MQGSRCPNGQAFNQSEKAVTVSGVKLRLLDDNSVLEFRFAFSSVQPSFEHQRHVHLNLSHG
jgi:hypothetical protein